MIASFATQQFQGFRLIPTTQSKPEDPSTAPNAAGPQLLRVLGLPTAAAMVVGNVIGSGIFVKPGIIAEHLGDFRLIMLAWVIGGVLCVLGGLCLAELAAMLPRAGGLYVYLREAYGPLTGFLLGWNELMFNRPAASGALSVILVRSIASALGNELSNLEEVLLAVLVVAVLAWINIRGVTWGGGVQVATTLVKIGFLLLIVVLPLVLWPLGRAPLSWDHWSETVKATTDGSLAARFGVVMLAVMWAYNGWHGVAPIAEEVRAPERNIPLALAWGIGLMILLYLGVNLAIHGVMSMSAVMDSGEHAAETMLEILLGPVGATAMAAVLVCSTLGAMNGDLLIVPRISFAMGRDKVFFRSFARVHPRYHTPAIAIGMQAAMCIALVLVSGLLVEFNPSFRQESVFELLTNFVIFSASIFYALAVLAVIVLRWRQPQRERPYRTWGYPVVPILYLGVYAWFLAEVYFSRPFEARSGLILIALGIPAYFAFVRWNARIERRAAIKYTAEN